MTVEASSSLGNVGTVLGGVLGGGAAAASDVSGNAGETTSAKVGDKVTLKGTSNKNCSYVGKWTVKKNGESTSAATIKGNGGSATAVFSEAGTFEIEHAYCEASHFLGFVGHSVKTETFTVVVQPATPARSISISGSDTVTQFSNIQLTATVDPAEATGTYEWSSSNEDILTVDNSGNVTGVRQGTATVTVSFISAVGGSEVSASKDVTVTATKDATDRALVYYLLDPTKDANSNDSGHWGKTSLGIARVNTTGATWAGGKNCFDNVDQRVVSWPNGTNVVPRDSDAWNEIFDNYKTTIQAQLPGVNFTKDDVEEIALVPAKISKNNGTNPDMHLDCNISIKCKNVALVKYYLRDAGSTQFKQKGARNYISGNATQPSDVMNEQFPETKTVDGVTYTFSGWYLDRSFTQPATFPYTVNSSTSFYAKYVGGFRVAYDLAGGSWNNSDATTYIAQEGSTQTVKSEPTREGYKFTGWTIEGLPDTTALKSGDTFTMPAGNVTITANWQELLSYQVKYLEKGTESQLEDPITQYGEQGHEVSADAKTIGGYHLVEGCPERITKTLGSSDNDITFWYEKDSVEYAVNYYLNGTEQKVADSETKSAPWDTQVKASDLAKGIDGYTAVPNQATTIIVNRDGKSCINVYYYQNVSLKANSAEVAYNGKDQSVSGFTGAPGGADFSGITVGANGTDADTYPAQFAEGAVGTVDKTEKYIVASVENGSLVIGKAKVTLKSADLSKAYDGTALENGGTALATEDGFVEGEGATYTFTGSQTLVGSSANAFTYTLNEGTKAENYDIEKTEGKLTVTDREEADKYEITVTANSATETYDGTEKTASGVTGTTSTNDKGAQFTVEGLSATVSGTDAGEYTNEVSGTPVVKDAAGNDVTSQFKVKTVNGKLVIDKRAVTIKPKNATKAYDGKPLKAIEWEIVSGSFVDGQSIADPQYNGSQTVPGSSESSITKWGYAEGTNAANYNITAAKGSLTVTDRADGEKYKITVKANSAESTYDGIEHAVEGFETLEFAVDGNEYTVSGLSASVSGTDAGIYPNNVTGTAKVTDAAGNDVTSQFSVTTESGSLVINKAKATIAPKDATKAYDGTDLKASEFVTEGFVKDQGVKSATFTGSQLNVGKSKSGIDGYVLADGTNANNYDITKGTGNLEVTPVSDEVTVTITGNAATLKYDGTEQSVTGYAVACSNGLYTANDFDFTGAAVAKGTNVGTYKMGLDKGQFSNTSANFSNVTFVVEDGWLKIEGGQIDANAITWTTQDVQKVYDGNPLSAFAAHATDKHGNELNVEYSIDGETWTFDPAEISLTHSGSQKVLLRATGSNYAAGQYATSSENIMINKRPVTLTSASANKVYDGKPLTNGTVTSTSLGVDVGFLDGEGVTCNVTGSQTNVGESANEFTYTFNEGTSKSDYLVTYEFGKLIVTQDNTEVVVTITEHSGAFEYDGTEKTVSGYDFSASNELYKNTDFEFTGNDSVSATNVGTYDMELKSEDFKNTNGNFSKVTFVVVDGQLTITPKSVDPEAGKGMSVGKLPHITYNGKSQKQKPEVKDGNTLLTEGTDYTLSYSEDTTNVGTVTVTVEGKGNYAGEAEVTYEILKRQVTLESASASKVYDGTPLTKPEVTVGGDGFVEGEVSGLKAIGTVTNVADGEVDNEIVWDWAEGFGEGNYDITKTEGKLSIEPQSIDPSNPESYTGIKVGELSDLLYKGKDQFQEPTVTDAKGNLLVKDRDYTLAFDGDAKNVTEAGVSVTVSGIGNYKGDFSRSYKILPREVTVKSASAFKAYDGTPLFSHDVVVTSAAGFVEDDVASMTAPNSITEVGSLTNEIAIEWSNDVAAGNYVVSKEEGVLEVTPKSVTAEGFSVEGLNDVTYNGLAQQQEPTVKDGDKTLTKDKDYTLSFTEDVTNVGTVRVAVTGKGNYTGSADVAYQILPAKLIVTTPSDSMVYNGKPLTAEGSIEGFVNNETAVFETTGSQTEVGESENAYAIYWSDEGTTAKRSNYTVEEHIGTLTVTEYADEIVAVANDVTMTYDGTPHRAEVTVTGVPEGYSVKTAWSGAEATDVTGADGLVANVDEIVVVNAEGKDVTDSLKITKKPGKLVIEPKELTVVTMGASKPYDGTPLTANGKIEGFVNGETAAFAVIGSQTEVGECTNAYTIEWSGNAKQGNYTVKEELGKLEVTKSQAAIVIVPKGGKKTYDGTPLVSEGADAYGLPAGFTCEATTKGSVTNVGSAVAEIDTYAIKNTDGKDVTDQFGNVSTGFATLLVTKRPVTVVSEDTSKVYDGTPLTKHKAGVTEGSMVDGESFVYEFTGTQTVAGESANSFMISAGDGTNLDNYEITKQDGTLKVEPKGVVPGEDNGMKVTKPVDKVYNGKEQKFVPVVTDGEKVLVENVDYVVTYTDALDFEGDAAAKDDFTNVTGDIFVTVEGIGNYTGSLTQSYQITPKPYTVTTVSGSKVYDGTPLDGASLEGNFVGGLVNNDDATFVVTGTQTEVGVSDNTYTLEFVDEQMAKNYKLVKEDIGTLTVVKDESEASQNSNGNGESKNKGALPKTGDMTLATLPFALAVVAGAVLCVAPVARRRSKF
ncbi:Ig-like domain-containing protein [Slackia isoflavoniconvertens]|uniref:Ig-like domain-containing protein n=1 Tax=Slackia isoflavoniconvertens TaxID=572010 RepID=UPI003AB8CAB6